MRHSKKWKMGAAALALLGASLFLAPPSGALCGDCVYISASPDCVSPPETYAFCRYYYTYDVFVVAGKIVRVKVRHCEGFSPCAV